MTRIAVFAIPTLVVCAALPAVATTPILYSNPAYESPVREDADELLLLPGYGFVTSDRVVYSLVTNTTVPPIPPAIGSVPTMSTADLGFADIITTGDGPYALTIHMPKATAGDFGDSAYALWVIDAAGEWSNGVLINDARPLWISPDIAYQTQAPANLPRVLKVIGRNLQPVLPTETQVRLTGPATYTMVASDDYDSLARYVARVALPRT